MTAVTLILQTVFSLLVIAALAYGVRLNRKLVELRDGQAKFAEAVGELDRAAARAESGLHALRTSTDVAEAELAGRIEAARELAATLSSLNSDAAIAVKRLENAARAVPPPSSNRTDERARAPEPDLGERRPAPHRERTALFDRDESADDPPLRRPEPAPARPQTRREADPFAAPLAAARAEAGAPVDTSDRLRRVAELLRAPDNGRGRNAAGTRR